MRILRNVFRRKLRAFLTIFGIAIGVFGLVVMGSIAEKLQLLVDGGTTYYADKVIVSAAGGIAGFSSAPMRVALVRDLERIPGVTRASASVMMMLEEEPDMVNMGSMPMIQATDGREDGYEKFVVRYAEGRGLEPGERGSVVIGSDLVKQLNAHVGGTIKIRDQRFRVVGILDKTLTAPDTVATINMEDAQQLFVDDLPDAIRSSINKADIASSIAVYVEPTKDPDRMADVIQRELGEDYATMGPEGFEKSVTEPLKIFNQIIYAIGAISLLVGGLAVINTMMMSVSERTKEIGVRKAIGATDGAILRQFVAESAVIGLLGGAIGLLLGWLVVTGGNAAAEASGTALFLLTGRLSAGAVMFAVVLGIVAGLYPAWHAARLNPVQALRYE